jgi:hypothetical protein
VVVQAVTQDREVQEVHTTLPVAVVLEVPEAAELDLMPTKITEVEEQGVALAYSGEVPVVAAARYLWVVEAAAQVEYQVVLHMIHLTVHL